MPCPQGHSFAFEAGKSCCSEIIDAQNNSRLLDVFDPPEHCGGEARMCPAYQLDDRGKCKSRTAGIWNAKLKVDMIRFVDCFLLFVKVTMDYVPSQIPFPSATELCAARLTLG